MNNRRAFTLLEMLAAMLITIIIMGALTSALYIGFRARASANRAVNATRTFDLVIDTITKDFRQIVPPKTGLLTPIAGDFTGYDTSVSFYITQMAASNEQRGGIRQVEYLINGGELIRRSYSTSNPLAETSEDGQDETIISNVKSFTLSYYDNSATSWQSSWDSTGNTTSPLPGAIEMILEFQEDGKTDVTRMMHIFKISTAVPVYSN